MNLNTIVLYASFILIGSLHATKYEEFMEIANDKSIRTGDRVDKLFPQIRSNIIGDSATFFGPFGCRKVVYADYFASGKSLRMVEDHLNEVVLP
jgi:hypothetical protein